MKRQDERTLWQQEIDTRCEPSRLAEVYVSDAYAHLVPPTRRLLGTPPRAQTSSQGVRSRPRDMREEERPWS